jgi:hypothetical protein
MTHITFSWDGWVYVYTGKTYWKERHNSACKNFREKVKILQEEYATAAGEYAKVFKK